MAYRGRLIWPFQCAIERLDTAATAANNLGQPSGYDRVFREPVRTSVADSRQYLDAVMLHCQVRTELGPNEKLVQLPSGRDLTFDVRLALHYQELETLGLLRTDGGVVFQPSDRLVGIYNRDGVTLVRDYTQVPLYCVHVQDRSWGLSGHMRNLVLLYFKDRAAGVAT